MRPPPDYSSRYGRPSTAYRPAHGGQVKKPLVLSSTVVMFHHFLARTNARMSKMQIAIASLRARGSWRLRGGGPRS